MGERNADEIWRAALSELKLAVTRPAFETWLKETRGERISGATLYVQARDDHSAEMIEQRLYSLALACAQRVEPAIRELSFFSSITSFESALLRDDPCPEREHSHRNHSTAEEICLHLARHLGCINPQEFLRGGIPLLMEALDELTGAYGWKLDHPKVRHPPGLLSFHLDKKIEQGSRRRANLRVIQGGGEGGV